jgi:hypothetical protein
MNTIHFSRRVITMFVVLALIGLGGLLVMSPLWGVPKEATKPQADKVKKISKWKNVTIEIKGTKRRVLINSYVCLRQGQLEQLLTRKRTKEHEAILAADVDARDIHFALLAAGAKTGSTVKFKKVGEKFVVIPPSGSRIKVTLQYMDKKKQVTIPAQKWIRQGQTKKSLAHDWVFAGSNFFKDPFDPKKPPIYGANDGDLICVANFDTAMLDLPIKSSKDNSELAFEAYTDRIPPLGTKVTIILEPVPEPKKK